MKESGSERAIGRGFVIMLEAPFRGDEGSFRCGRCTASPSGASRTSERFDAVDAIQI